MKSMTKLGKGVIGAVVSIALFIGCLPITATPVLAAEGDTPAVITLGGTSTGTNYRLPIRVDRQHSISEQIYTATELGNAGGTISSIAFYATGAVNSRNIRVYLLDTTQTSITSNYGWITSNYQLCYQGSVSFTANNWTTINFTTSFKHAADRNLAVLVIDYTGSTATQRNFRTYNGTSNSAIYASRTTNQQYTITNLSTVTGTRGAAKPAIQITILKDMTVSAPDVEVDYDGQAHGIEVNVTNPSSGATIVYGETEGTYDLTESPTYTTGTHTVYYKVSATGYATVTGSADVIINGGSEIEVTATGYDGPYDGDYHTIDVNVTAPESYTIHYGTSEGSYPMSNPPEYLTGNHTIYYEVTADGYTPATGSVDINISNLNITATVEGYTGNYDGDLHGISITVDAPASGSTIQYRESETAEWSDTAPTYSYGTHTVYYQISATGYNPLTGSETVDISNANMTVNAEDYSGSWDGEAHSISVSVTKPSTGYTIQYRTSSSEEWSEENPAFTDVGTYTVYYQITAERYNTVTGSKTVTISAAAMTVSSSGFTGAYDGNPHGITVTVTTPSTGYTIEYRETTTGEWSETAPTYTTGTHTVYYRVTATGYAEATGSENVVINNATISYTASNYDAGYDGQPHSIIVNVTEPATGYTIEYRTSQTGNWTTTAPTVTNPNNYAQTVYFRISAPGYTTTDQASRTIRVRSGTIDYTAEGYTGAYDGQAHGISITVSAPTTGYTIEYRTNQYGNWTTTAPTRSTPGTTTVYYRITATNYTQVTGNRTITISNGTIDYNAEGYSGTYDGSAHSISVNVTAPATGATIQYREAGTTTWRNTNPGFTAAGIHTVEYRIQATNYTTVTGSETVTIDPAQISYTATGYSGSYDGTAHGITVSVTEPTDATVEYSESAEGPWSTTPVTRTSTGTTTVYFRISADNYEMTEVDSAEIDISAAEMTYSASGYTGTYDGEAHGITVSVTNPTDATIEYSETATGPWAETPVTSTDVGETTVYYRITADNYETVTGHETIKISEGTIAYTANGYTGPYDGQPHSISIEVTYPTSGVTIEYRTNTSQEWSTENPTFTDTGTRTVYYRLSATGYATKTGSVNVVINPGTIDYDAANYSGSYDGQAHGISITVSAPASGYTIEYRTSQYGNWTTTAPTRSTPGTTTVYYRITATNYTQVTGNRTITISNGTIDYNAEGYSGTYDGSAHRISVSVTTPATGATIQYREAGTTTWRNTNPGFTAAGIHTVEYRIQATNYTTVTGSETVTIDPAQMVYSAEGFTGTYDGQTHRISVSVTTPATGAQIRYRSQGSTNWSATNPGYTAQGTYVVEYRIQATNYAEVTGSATITINPADMTVTATGHEGTWDGSSYGIVVSVTKPASGYTIRYGTTEGTYNLNNSPVYSDVGDYTVYYRVTASNYNTFTGSATISITPADMSVTATGYSGSYDGSAHGITVTVTTPSSGATVMYGTTEGTYDLTASPTFTTGENTVYYRVTAPNYSPFTGSATVSIANIDITATADGWTGDYDGDPHGITVTVTEPASGATVMYGTTEGTYDLSASPTYTDAGDYTVYFQVTAEGHNDYTGSATVSIGSLTIDATVEGYDGIYDEASHGISVTVNTPATGATVMYGDTEGSYDYTSSPEYTEVGLYTVYYQITADNYDALTGSATVSIDENPDRRDARERLTDLVNTSNDVLDEWEELLPEDMVEDLEDAIDYAEDVLADMSSTEAELNGASDYLGGVLGDVLAYIDYYYGDDEPSLTPEQRRMLSIENFVENLYLNALGRVYDLNGRDYWVSILVDQNGTGSQIARGFLNSPEFIGFGLDNEGFVRTLYVALFNRIPEDAEVAVWTNALASGVTRDEVINSFLASPEWEKVCAYYCVNV